MKLLLLPKPTIKTITALFVALSLYAMKMPTTMATPSTDNIGSMKTLEWTGCSGASGGYAELEFCKSGTNYGYRVPGTNTCGELGPLIVMDPGSTYRLVLTNTLSEKEGANIHTHGLHISGDHTISPGADDITQYAQPGGSIEYIWFIPLNHMGGTHWYHAHVHGKSEAHVNGGAFGMLVITDQSNVSNDAAIQAWLNNDIYLVASESSNLGTAGNGISNGGDTFVRVPNEWYRLRILAVDSGGKSQALTIPNGCEVHPVSHDGIWRFSIPKAGDSINSYQLTGSTRLDVAIKCGQGDHEITFGGGGMPPVVMTLSATSTSPPSTASPYHNNGQWSPPRPDYLLDMRQETVDDTFEVTLSGGNLNGAKWNEEVPLQNFGLGNVQEWTISGSGQHPMHLHVHHMQIIQPGGCGDMFDEGEYVDTIQSGVGDCLVRFRLADHPGRTVMHCHVLRHEDGGGMGWVNIVSSPTTPVPVTPAPVTPAPVIPVPTPAGGCNIVECGNGEPCCDGFCQQNGQQRCTEPLPPTTLSSTPEPTASPPAPTANGAMGMGAMRKIRHRRL